MKKGNKPAVVPLQVKAELTGRRRINIVQRSGNLSRDVTAQSSDEITGG